tara:strand:- start:312 stop:518 length:207 start_codon:yes stop_codon:yes gene_type:complete
MKKLKIFYTDRVGDDLYIDSLTGLEYFKSLAPNAKWGDYKYIWESREAGEVLIKTIEVSPRVEFIKRT